MSVQGGQQHKGLAWWCGWGGFVLVAFLGAVSSGLSGLLILAGLFALVVAVFALLRGRVSWAMLRNRVAAGVAIFVALGLLVAGGAVADSPAKAGSEPTGESAGTSTTAATSASSSTKASSTASSSSPHTSSPSPKSPTAAAAATHESTRPARGTALAAVAGLTVKGRAAKTGYDRDAFGQAWFDADRNGCDTRNDVLRRDLTNRSMKNWCKVLAGTLSKDPYTGQSIRFVYGGASEIDIDHVVALGDAWQKGASYWSFSKRLALANDPVNLLAVDAGANRSKGDGDAATWLPPNKAFRCKYVARQITVKKKYGLWVTSAERDAMVRVLSNCDGTALPGQGTAPTSAQPPRTHTAAPAPTTTVPKPPAPKTTAPVQPPVPVYYANCDAVRAAGAAPIHVGDPGYSRKLDRDGDGIGCE